MTPEGKIVDYLTKQSVKMGFRVRKLSYEGRRGAPDRMILAPGAAAFVEVKAPGRKPRPEQDREIALLRSAGLDARWLSSKEEVDYLIGELWMASHGGDRE